MKSHKSVSTQAKLARMNPGFVGVSDVSSGYCKVMPEAAVSSVKASVRFSSEIEGHKVSNSQWQAIEAMADCVNIHYA